MKFVLRVPARQRGCVSLGPTRFIAPFPTSDTSRPNLTMAYWQTSSQTSLHAHCLSPRENIRTRSRTFSIAPASAANVSGFLQVSLSKVLGRLHLAFHPHMSRLALPMNASDLSLSLFDKNTCSRFGANRNWLRQNSAVTYFSLITLREPTNN
jgi:hypothetical protein